MGFFKRKKKTAEPVSEFRILNGIKIPLVPFGDNITKSASAIVPIDGKADYVPVNVNQKMVDNDILKFLQSKIQDYFGVSVSVFSNFYNEDEINAFYESTIEPLAIVLSEAFSLGLLTNNQLQRGEEIIFFSERLQYASWNNKVTAIGKSMGLGIMSPIESRG